MPAALRRALRRRAHGAGLFEYLPTAGSSGNPTYHSFGWSSQLHENGVAQQYYIATKSSPADDRARVLKYGRLFSVFDHLGDIQTSGLGEQGLFFEGTRHLSEFLLRLWDAHPLPLSSTIETNNFLFRAHLTNLDVSHLDRVVIPRGTFHLQRSKFLWRDVCNEEFAFVNYGPSSLQVPCTIAFGADFADIFEVRGMHRQKRGQRLEDRVGRDMAILSYGGLDNKIRQTRIQCDPAPTRISASELHFDLELQPGARSVFHWRSLATTLLPPIRLAIAARSVLPGLSIRTFLKLFRRFTVRILVLPIGSDVPLPMCR